MRIQAALVCAALLCPVAAVSQQALPSAPEPAAKWQLVESLPHGAPVYLKTTTRHLSCHLQSVEAESFHCGSAADAAFARPEIRSIERAHRGRSLLVGVAVGAGAGAIIGAATAPKGCTPNTFCLDIFSRADVTAIGALVGGVLGAPVGYFTDFTRSSVYKIK